MLLGSFRFLILFFLNIFLSFLLFYFFIPISFSCFYLFHFHCIILFFSFSSYFIFFSFSFFHIFFFYALTLLRYWISEGVDIEREIKDNGCKKDEDRNWQGKCLSFCVYRSVFMFLAKLTLATFPCFLLLNLWRHSILHPTKHSLLILYKLQYPADDRVATLDNLCIFSPEQE